MRHAGYWSIGVAAGALLWGGTSIAQDTPEGLPDILAEAVAAREGVRDVAAAQTVEGLEWIDRLGELEHTGRVDRLAELERLSALVRTEGVAGALAGVLPGNTATLDLEGIRGPDDVGAVDIAGIRMSPDAEAMRQAEATARDSGVGGGIPTSRNSAILSVFGRIAGGGGGGNAQPQEPPPGSLLIFGSLSVPEEQLRELLVAASQPDTGFVLRGAEPGKPMTDAIARLQPLIEDPEDPPNMTIDPTLFQRYSVTVAPTMVLVRGPGLPPLRASGAIEPQRLRNAADGLALGGRPDLGQFGEVYEILEQDMLAAMQERVARFTGEAPETIPVAAAQPQGSAFDLPDAPADAEYTVDPSVQLVADVTDADGNVVAPAGQLFNPLETRPMTTRVVAFRATSSAHARKAAEIAEEASAAGERVAFMAAASARAPEGRLEELSQELGAPVHVLDPVLAERLRVRHLPSAVSGAGDRLLVQEWAVESEGDTNDLMETLEEANEVREVVEDLERVFRIFR